MSIRETWTLAARALVDAGGEPVVWKPDTEDEREITGIFNYGHQRVQAHNVNIATRRAQLTVCKEDLPNPAQDGDQVQIRGELYQVATPKADEEDVKVVMSLKKLT